MSEIQNVNPTTFSEALKTFKLDWKVESRPLYTFDNEGQQLIVEGSKAIVRADIGLPLGVVGSRYVIQQNNFAESVIDAVIAKTGGEFVKGGVFDHGRKIYVQAKLPDVVRIKDSDDVTNKYLTLVSSHDGSTLTGLGFSGVRVVCLNTFMMALKDVRRQVAIPHTISAETRLNAAQAILESQLVYFRELEIKANWLADQRFTDIQMEAALAKVMNVEGEEEVNTRTRNIMDTILGNFQNHDGSGGTAWASYNAFTRWSNHQKGTRGIEGNEAQAERRFENLLIGQSAAFNDRALSAIETVLAA